jgi:diguanylate cyclase (GGDEF)-like protein
MASDYGIGWMQPAIDSEQLLNQLVGQVRDARQVSELLTDIAEPMRQLLDVDRLNFYQLADTGHWQVVAEAIRESRWEGKADRQLSSLLGKNLSPQHIPKAHCDLMVVDRQWLVVDSQTGKTSFYYQPTTSREFFAQSPNHPNYAAELRELGAVTYLLIPILQQNNLWGVLAGHHRQSKRFGQKQLQTMQMVIDQISIGVAQSQLLARAHLQKQQEALIRRMNELLRGLDGSSTPALLAELSQALHADGSRLYVISELIGQPAQIYRQGSQPETPVEVEKNALWQRLMYGEVTEGVGASLCDSTYQHQVYAVSDIYQQPMLESLYFSLRAAGIQSLLILPLRYNHQCIGCLTLFREAAWIGGEVQMAQALALHLYTAVMQQRIESMFRHQSYYDVLTGLPNRLLLQQRLTLALAKAQENDELLAVLFLDLDRFKKINDSLGHSIGDRLLQMVASRLQHAVDPGVVLGRWGGDEFTFLVSGFGDLAELEAIAQGILDDLAGPFEFENNFIHLNSNYLYLQGSMGIAVFPYDGEDGDTLLKHADAALYLAKQRGCGYETYSAAIGSQAMQRLRLENLLYRALDRTTRSNAVGREQLILHYQPQVNARDRRVVGVEALLRCSDAQAKPIRPLDFIPVAEDTGLIVQIGEWVLREACAQNKRWQEQGLGFFPIAVNLSVKQIQQPDFVAVVKKALGESGLAAAYLEVEITESMAIGNLSETIRVLQELRDSGVKVSLDDFGTGYSSLSALKHLPLDQMKVDRSFIQELKADSIDAGIVRTIVNLGRELGLEVVAEGVETPEQLDFLASVDCFAVQGYLFSRPLPAGELAGSIADGRWLG